VRADRRLPEQDTDIPLPSIPSPRLGGVPRDRAEHRAEIHRRFELLAECEPDSARYRTLRDELIAEHMNYARYVASRFSVPADTAEDLEQVAYLALIKAVDNFDPARGTAFLGYLTPMVAGEIKRYFRDSTWDVHVPRRMQELSSSLRKATEALTQELGRSPSVEELAKTTHSTTEQVVEALDSSRAYNTVSLSAPAPDEGDEDGGDPLEHFGDEDEGFELAEERQLLREGFKDLGDRERSILHMRFFLGMTQSEIADQVGISQMHVSRLIRQSIDRVREQLDSEPEPERGTVARRPRRRTRGSARRGASARPKRQTSRTASA